MLEGEEEDRVERASRNATEVGGREGCGYKINHTYTPAWIYPQTSKSLALCLYMYGDLDHRVRASILLHT